MKATPSDLAGRTALVTGAGKRVGRAIGLALARQGANIIAHYNTSAGETEDLARQVLDLGHKAWTIAANLAEPDQAKGLIGRVREMAGPFDILVNNASIFPIDTFADVTVESIVANEQINAISPFLLAREFAALGVEGDIINLLDTRIVDYDARHFGYHISKRTLLTLTQVMAVELAPKIKVNSVAPGLVLPPAGQDESYLANLAHTNPLQRYGSAEEVAEAVVFLLRSNFITGQIIYVDGGRHMKGSFYGGI